MGADLVECPKCGRWVGRGLPENLCLLCAADKRDEENRGPRERLEEAVRLLREIDIELVGINLYARGQIVRDEIGAFLSTAAQRGEKEG